jgi:hypothetical protein
MGLPPYRRNLVIWSPGTGPVDCAPKFARGRRIRKCIRTGALLTVIGLMRAARIVRTRWEAHKQRCELERELAAYSTPAQRRDLEATLNQYPDELTYELRNILARQAMAAYCNRGGVPGAGKY